MYISCPVTLITDKFQLAVFVICHTVSIVHNIRCFITELLHLCSSVYRCKGLIKEFFAFQFFLDSLKSRLITFHLIDQLLTFCSVKHVFIFFYLIFHTARIGKSICFFFPDGMFFCRILQFLFYYVQCIFCIFCSDLSALCTCPIVVQRVTPFINIGSYILIHRLLITGHDGISFVFIICNAVREVFSCLIFPTGRTVFLIAFFVICRCIQFIVPGQQIAFSAKCIHRIFIIHCCHELVIRCFIQRIPQRYLFCRIDKACHCTVQQIKFLLCRRCILYTGLIIIVIMTDCRTNHKRHTQTTTFILHFRTVQILVDFGIVREIFQLFIQFIQLVLGIFKCILAFFHSFCEVCLCLHSFYHLFIIFDLIDFVQYHIGHTHRRAVFHVFQDLLFFYLGLIDLGCFHIDHFKALFHQIQHLLVIPGITQSVSI